PRTTRSTGSRRSAARRSCWRDPRMTLFRPSMRALWRSGSAARSSFCSSAEPTTSSMSSPTRSPARCWRFSRACPPGQRAKWERLPSRRSGRAPEALVLQEPLDDEAKEKEAEFRVLVVELQDLFVGDRAGLDVRLADGRCRAAILRGEQPDLAQEMS